MNESFAHAPSNSKIKSPHFLFFLLLLLFLILFSPPKSSKPNATFSKPSPTTLQISFTGALRSKIDSTGADIMVALYESGLVTDCASGENKGRMLANDYAVRRLEKMASVKDIAAKKSITGSVQFDLWNGVNLAKCGIVLFVQNTSLHTFGVQKIQIPDTV